MQKNKYHNVGHTYFIWYDSKVPGGVFFDEACIEFFLVRILNSLRQFHIKIHAYCITPQRIYFILTPTTPSGIFSQWQSVAQQYNEYYRSRFSRGGRPVSNCFQSRVIRDDSEFVSYQALTELLPVNEGLVSNAGQYRYSSFSANGFGLRNKFLKQHEQFARYLYRQRNSLSVYRDSLEELSQPASSNVG